MLEVRLGQIRGNCPRKTRGPYEVFFLRSAQRFFIASDKRLLPSGVIPPPSRAFNTGGRGTETLVFLAIRGEVVPSKSAMARLSRSLSFFKSATILSRSKTGFSLSFVSLI